MAGEQVAVEAAAGEQVVVGALLDDPAAVHDHDRVGPADRAQPAGDHDAGTAQGGQVPVDRRLGQGVEGARGLVEKENRRPVGQGPG